MKKKICPWLDSNIKGGLQILNNRMQPCCNTISTLYSEKNLDYSKLSIEELMQKRKEFAHLLNEGKVCKDCKQIIEKEEAEIDIGKINYLSLGLFSTCNLRCRYCYFSEKDLSQKLTDDRTYLLPFIKRLAENNVLKEDVCLALAGGEPLLFNDIPQTLEFLANNYKAPSLLLLSNSSITSKVNQIIKDFKKTDKKLKKTLYTSIDSGTKETYKNLRGKDLFVEVKNNITNYAKNNTFDKIILKYILMFDKSNISNKDIFGFLFFLYKISRYQKGSVALTIDCDMMANGNFDNDMILAASKLYYVAVKILGIEVLFMGTGLVDSSEQGRIKIQKTQEGARNYEKSNKPFIERYWLLLLCILSNLNNIKKIFKSFKRFLKLVKILYFQ